VADAAAAEGCWANEAALVLKLTGSHEQAGWACSQAHGPRGAFALQCEEGIGQQASAQARAHGGDAFAPCGLLNATAEQHCVFGAVEETVNEADDIAPGIALCARAPAGDQRACYAAIGTMHRSMQSDANVRVAECASVPQAYRPLCAAM